MIISGKLWKIYIFLNINLNKIQKYVLRNYIRKLYHNQTCDYDSRWHDLKISYWKSIWSVPLQFFIIKLRIIHIISLFR